MKTISQLPTEVNLEVNPINLESLGSNESIWMSDVGKIKQKIKNSRSRISLAGGVCKQTGRHTFRVWYPWRGCKGNRIFINTYLDGTPLHCQEQAVRVLEKIRAEVDQGTFDPDLWGKDKTLQIENAWDVYQQQRRCGKDRMEARERIFKDFILPYFKDKHDFFSLKQIEEHHIMEWWVGIPKTYAQSYLKVIRATLRAFLNFHRVTRVKAFQFPVVKVPHKTPVWYSKREQEEVLEFIPSHHQPVIRFLMAYGCRVSESCNLKKTDIDWVKNEITFRERKNDKENTLPIFDEAISLLKESGKVTNLSLVFCTANGERYTRQVLYRLWIDASKAANKKYGTKIIPLKNGTRHSLACQLLQRGESISTVARILGNTPSVIERSYGAISVKTAGEALRKVYNG